MIKTRLIFLITNKLLKTLTIKIKTPLLNIVDSQVNYTLIFEVFFTTILYLYIAKNMDQFTDTGRVEEYPSTKVSNMKHVRANGGVIIE